MGGAAFVSAPPSRTRGVIVHERTRLGGRSFTLTIARAAMSRQFDHSARHKEHTHPRASSDRDGRASALEKEHRHESNGSPLATSLPLLGGAISQADGDA